MTDQRKILSLLMITKNSEELLEKSLSSIKDIVDEIVIIDTQSHDKTVEIAQRFGARIFQKDESDLGKKRAYGLSKTRGKWILVLDSDEIVPDTLRREIKEKIRIAEQDGFLIPFQNHFLGRPIRHGGENYKMLRLFKKKAVSISPSLVHEKFVLKKGFTLSEAKGKIYHYSYRSYIQLFKKFTDYALREAKQKLKKGEKPSFEKIFLYPIHMFWARFIEDKGYKDGLFRIPLDLGFAYMEFLTYFSMLFL